MTYISKEHGHKKIVGRYDVEMPAQTLECKTRGEGCYLPGYFKYQEDEQGRRYRTKFHKMTAHTVSMPIFEGETAPKI